jgi:hypothetical protein
MFFLCQELGVLAGLPLQEGRVLKRSENGSLATDEDTYPANTAAAVSTLSTVAFPARSHRRRLSSDSPVQPRFMC